MNRIRLAVAALVALVPLALASPAAAATKLVATVGPGYTITLKTATGKRVTTLKRGTYTIVVRDRSDEHNFHLKGPGVSRASGVEFVGTRTWTVRLRAGKYTYVCDPHVDSMKAGFTVR